MKAGTYTTSDALALAHSSADGRFLRKTHGAERLPKTSDIGVNPEADSTILVEIRNKSQKNGN